MKEGLNANNMHGALDVNDILVTNPGRICRKEEDGAYLFDLDSGNLKYINNSGLFIYEKCDGVNTVDAIIKLLHLSYPGEDPGQLTAEALNYLSLLIDADLLLRVN
jgi:hypothetical protein